MALGKNDFNRWLNETYISGLTLEQLKDVMNKYAFDVGASPQNNSFAPFNIGSRILSNGSYLKDPAIMPIRFNGYQTTQKSGRTVRADVVAKSGGSITVNVTVEVDNTSTTNNVSTN